MNLHQGKANLYGVDLHSERLTSGKISITRHSLVVQVLVTKEHFYFYSKKEFNEWYKGIFGVRLNAQTIDKYVESKEILVTRGLRFEQLTLVEARAKYPDVIIYSEETYANSKASTAYLAKDYPKKTRDQALAKDSKVICVVDHTLRIAVRADSIRQAAQYYAGLKEGGYTSMETRRTVFSKALNSGLMRAGRFQVVKSSVFEAYLKDNDKGQFSDKQKAVDFAQLYHFPETREIPVFNNDNKI